jgi:hypothetical protein
MGWALYRLYCSAAFGVRFGAGQYSGGPRSVHGMRLAVRRCVAFPYTLLREQTARQLRVGFSKILTPALVSVLRFCQRLGTYTWPATRLRAVERRSYLFRHQKLSNSMKHLLSISAGLFCAAIASAQPTMESYGSIAGFIAGTSPTVHSDVSISSGSGLTLGMTAQQRFFNPALTNDGAGTFYATTGQNNGLGTSSFQGATWNFDFYIGTTTPTAYTFELTYGLAGGTVFSFNPLADGDAFSLAKYGPNNWQDSQNLLFSNFGGAPNLFSPGSGGTFNPNANATYDFLLTAKDVSGAVVEQAGIRVQVGTGSPVPDAGSTCLMLGAALLGFAGIRRKFVA